MKRQDYSGLADVVRDGARAGPDKLALSFEGREAVTYRQLDEGSSRAAQMLREAGVRAGDRVAMLGKNSVALVEVLFGAAKLGAVFTPINWRLAPAEVTFILRDSGAAAVVVDAELRALVQQETLPGLAVIAVGEKGPDGYAARHAGASAEDPRASVAPENLAMLVYTSGTTGLPKGTMLSHRSFARHCDMDRADAPSGMRILPDDVLLMALPLFHIGGIEPVLRNLFGRASVVLHREFDPARVIADTQACGVTILALVPTALQMVLAHPAARAADLSGVRRFVYGASPIPLPVLKEALARLGCEFLQAYGMTETCATAVVLSPEDHLDPAAPRLRSAGRACPGAEMRVLKAGGHHALPREVGEVALRGDCLFSGYWNRPDATAEAMTGDGWLKTGDAGWLDEDGYLYIHDRVKDMICSGGENVYPAEVERAIHGHPDVAEVAVVGVPDPRWGEVVKAIVVAKPGHVVDEGHVIAWARERIAAYKTPRSVDVIAELPKNAAGKILRRSLREGYWAAQERRVN